MLASTHVTMLQGTHRCSCLLCFPRAVRLAVEQGAHPWAQEESQTGHAVVSVLVAHPETHSLYDCVTV